MVRYYLQMPYSLPWFLFCFFVPSFAWEALHIARRSLLVLALRVQLSLTWFVVLAFTFKDVAAKATSVLYDADTVALFNAQSMEVDRIDVPLREYERLAIDNEWMYASQNLVQTLLYTLGFTACLALAAAGVVNGTLTVGDVVMVSSLLSQLWCVCLYL